MRILSARIVRARLDRDTKRVEAVVALTAMRDGTGLPDMVRIAVSAPAHAPGSAPLRERLTAAAKLTYATTPRRDRYAA